MQDIRIIREALGSRLKAQSKNLCVDASKMASRYVCERILANFHNAFGPAHFKVVGGLLFPQHVRPTADADIRVVRSYSHAELENGMRVVADLLRSEGIEFAKIDAPRVLDTGEADTTIRLRFDATAGGIRANSHIDLTVVRGPYAFSERTRKTDLPALFRGAPQLTAYAQPLAAAAAEKWLACIAQRDTDMRLKFHLDLVQLVDLGLKPEAVAKELLRVLVHRGQKLSALREQPRGLTRSFLDFRRHDWERLAEERNFDLPYEMGVAKLQRAWLQTYEAVSDLVDEYRQAKAVAVSPRMQRGNVVAFGR